MKKVLQIRCTGQLLGAERVILELGGKLPNFGYEMIIGIPVEEGQPEPEMVSAAQALGYNVVLFPIKGAFDLNVLKTIKRYVIENKVDIVHSHGYREDLYAIGCKKVAKLVATNHLWKRRDWKLKLYAKLDAFLLKFFDRLVAVSKPVAKDMVSEGLKMKQITLVQNGIDTEAYRNTTSQQQIRTSLGLDKDTIVMCTLSSLTQEKGIDLALEALAKLGEQPQKLVLLVIGEGPEESGLKAMAKTLGIDDRVIFTGRRNDIPEVMSCTNLFLLPSYIEGLPMALLEAMASGCAVVATAVGDVPDVVDNEVGRLIEPGNSTQLSEAIYELISNSQGLSFYGRKAQDRVTDRFSSEAMAKGYADVYRRVLEEK